MVQVETPQPYAKQGWWLSDWVSQKSALQEETQILKKLTGAMEFFLNLTPVLDYRCIQSRKVWRKEGEKSSTHNPKRTHQSVSWIRWLSTNLVLPLPSCGILGSFMFPLGLIFLIHKMDIMVIVPTLQDYGKESPCSAGDLGLIPGSGRSPGEGNGNPLQYSCLENAMDTGAWQTTVCGVTRVGHNLATKPPLQR